MDPSRNEKKPPKRSSREKRMLSRIADLLPYGWEPSRHLLPERQEAISYYICKSTHSLNWKNADFAKGFGYLLEHWVLSVLACQFNDNDSQTLQFLEAPLSMDRQGVDCLVATKGPDAEVLAAIDFTSKPSYSEDGEPLFTNHASRGNRKSHKALRMGNTFVPLIIVSLHDLMIEDLRGGLINVYNYLCLHVVSEYQTDNYRTFPYPNLPLDEQRQQLHNSLKTILIQHLKQALQHYAYYGYKEKTQSMTSQLITLLTVQQKKKPNGSR